MSAFQVSPNHIGAILRWYLFDGITREHDRARWRDHYPTRDDAADMAQCLSLENHKSMSHRYPDHDQAPEIVDTENLGVYRELTPIECIKSVHCLEYQSCEHDAWEASEARKLCRDIIECAISRVPGYDAAPWGIDDRATHVSYSLVDMMNKPKRRSGK